MDVDKITCQFQVSADPQRVWNALTNAEEFGCWFHVKLDGPFAVGRTTTGIMTYPGHEGIPWTSVTKTMEAPSHFVFCWPNCPPGEEPSPDTNWLTVSFTLEAHNGGTLITVCETGFAALPEEQRISMLRDNRQGWEIQSKNLQHYVDG